MNAEFTVAGACSECHRLGWLPFNHGTEIQRCDNCKVFADDDAAMAHAIGLAVGALKRPKRRSGKRFADACDDAEPSRPPPGGEIALVVLADPRFLNEAGRERVIDDLRLFLAQDVYEHRALPRLERDATIELQWGVHRDASYGIYELLGPYPTITEALAASVFDGFWADRGQLVIVALVDPGRLRSDHCGAVIDKVRAALAPRFQEDDSQ